MDEKELLKSCINNDHNSRDRFVEQYSRLIYHSIHTTFRKYFRDYTDEDVQDLHGEIFISLFERDCRKLRQYRGINNCSVAQWLRVIAIRMTINHIRGDRQLSSLDHMPGGDVRQGGTVEGETVLDTLITEEKRAALFRLINELSPQDRLLLKYSVQKALPAEKVAALMKISVNAVYIRKNRIIARLKERARAHDRKTVS